MDSVFSIERKYPCHEMDIEKLNCDKKETTMNIKYDKELVKSISEQKEKLIDTIINKMKEANELYFHIHKELYNTVVGIRKYKQVNKLCNAVKIGQYGALMIKDITRDSYYLYIEKDKCRSKLLSELQYINDNIKHDMQIIIDAVIKQAKEE